MPLIYRALFVQTRGALKKELLERLRRTRGMRRPRHYTQKTPIHGRIVAAVPVSERPACIPMSKAYQPSENPDAKLRIQG